MGRKHNKQAPRDRITFVCTHCKTGDCVNCMDVVRAAVNMEPLCKCQRKGHGGEPIECQVADPFDGSVHAPHAVISADGEVTFDEEWQRQWKQQFDR